MVQNPQQRKGCTILSEKRPSTAIFTPPKPLSTRSYLFSVRPQLSNCACSIYFGRQSYQTLFFSGLPAQILKGIQGSTQTTQLASWITHDSMLYYKRVSFFNSRCNGKNRMKNRRGEHFGTTADKDEKAGKHLKCYVSSYSNQDMIKYSRFGMLIIFAMSVPCPVSIYSPNTPKADHWVLQTKMKASKTQFNNTNQRCDLLLKTWN